MTQDTLQRAKERYKDATDAFRDQRDRMVADLQFSNPADPKQWDQRDLDIRQKGADGARPCLTLDRTNQYIAQVVNDARQNKPGIEFLPASTGASQEVATALNGFMRHIEYQSRASMAYDTAIDHAARMGLGYARITPEVVDAELNYQEIRIQRIHDPLSVVADPDWCEPDGSDIQYAFIETELTKPAFQRIYPKFDANSWGNDAQWFGKDTVKICEYFELEKTKVNSLVIALPDGSMQSLSEDAYWSKAKELGYQPQVDRQYQAEKQKVIWRKMNGVEILEETTFPSRYIPLVPMVGHELWIEGKRYLCGMTRRMMDAQKLYNYERSAWAEAIALQPKAPFIIAEESVEDFKEDWSRANKANLGYLRFKAYDDEGRVLPIPKRSEPPQMPMAFSQGAQFADADIQASIGMYRANLGAPSNETSGKAINARKTEGDTANYHYIDNQSAFIARIGVIVLDMIPNVYDQPREAAILGHDGSTKSLRIDPNGSAYEVRDDVTVINPSTGTYSVRVKAGPSYTSLREEASGALTQIMSNPNLAPIVGPIWARMQDWPESDKLAKALLSVAPQPVQQALSDEQSQDDADMLKQQLAQLGQQLQQAQQQIQQLHAGLVEADQEHQQREAEMARLKSQSESDAMKVKIDAYKAETERFKAMLDHGLMPPELSIVHEETTQALTHEIVEDEPGEPPEMNEQPEQPAPAGFFTPNENEGQAQ